MKNLGVAFMVVIGALLLSACAETSTKGISHFELRIAEKCEEEIAGGYFEIRFSEYSIPVRVKITPDYEGLEGDERWEQLIKDLEKKREEGYIAKVPTLEDLKRIAKEWNIIEEVCK